MWSENEIEVVGKADGTAAINEVLQDALVYDGKINLDLAPATTIDYAIHLLRHYKALNHR